MERNDMGPPAGCKSERHKGEDKYKVSSYISLLLAAKVKNHCFYEQMSISELVSKALREKFDNTTQTDS